MGCKVSKVVVEFLLLPNPSEREILAHDFMTSLQPFSSNEKFTYADSWSWNQRDDEVSLGAASPHDEADLFFFFGGGG